jgi:hypothetical protein
MNDFPELLEPLRDAVTLLEQYRRQFDAVPVDLILALKAELARYPINVVTTFYGWLIREQPAIAVFFCKDTDDEDDESGPHERSLDDFLMTHPIFTAM